jgi:hypothetical protein
VVAISTAALDGMRQLADVAGPEVILERLACGPIEPGLRAPVLVRVSSQVMRGERGDILAPLAQRRQVDDDRVQPVEQVFPEAARSDLAARSALVADSTRTLT